MRRREIKGSIRAGTWLLAPLAILAAVSAAGGASRAEIDRIRNLSVLTEDHLNLINQFVEEQFRLLAAVTDAAAASEVTKDLAETAQSSTRETATQRSYSDRYSRAVKNAYGPIYQRSLQMRQDPDESVQNLGMQMALATGVILAAADNPVLIDDLAALLKDPAEIVRYWAAKGLAQTEVLGFLANEENANLATTVLTALDQAADQSDSGATLAQIAMAADLLNANRSVELIDKCLRKRMDQYRGWTVQEEWTDMELITYVVTVAGQEAIYRQPELRNRLILGVVELYHAAYERYRIGLHFKTDDTTVDLLNEQSQSALETILIEGERLLINLATREIPPPGSRFQAALKEPTPKRLSTAYDLLLSKTGAVNRAFQIYSENYSLNPFPNPPPKIIERALNLQTLEKNLITGE
ncbi:MAG: hypothetical protein JW810_13655 [Sedimentisphaerales bacterium]|nr:hypothetical protein [Sedimentisphaerales bacterium]